MILIGLTGGIASGKSTVAALLVTKGARVIDADLIAREVLAPTGPAFDAVVERFGREVLTDSGTIDRSRLAASVFGDPAARRELEAITHPEIYREIVRMIEESRDGEDVVVLDAALLVETMGDRGEGLGLDALVVVASNVEDQIERMISERSMSEEQARARMSAQAPQERKLAVADYILDNRGALPVLKKSVDLLWEDLMNQFANGRRSAKAGDK